jgi:hypothetical protein
MQTEIHLPMSALRVERESACPVHFLWDSVGAGRWLVRLGFLGFLTAGLLMTASVMVHASSLKSASGAVALASAAAWLVGHALTRVKRSLTR